MDDLSRKINILLDVDKSFIPKAEYIFRTFCKIVGLQPEFFYDYTLELINVYYGASPEDKYPIEIYHNDETAELFKKQLPYDEEDFHFIQYRNENVPFLFSQPGLLFHQANASLKIRKDIIASAFFFLSCWEEYLYAKNSKRPVKINKKTVLKEKTYLSRKWDFSLLPVVDRYSEIFQKALEIVMPGYFKVNKWHNKENFAVSITHLLYPEHIDNTPESDNRIKDIAKVFHNEEKKGISSAIFLPALFNENRGKEDGDEDLLSLSAFKLGRKKTLFTVSFATEKSVGVYTDKILTGEELDISAEHYAKNGFDVRGHCYVNLQEHYHNLFYQLEKSNIVYDLSIHFHKSVGYRAGISYPYNPFNIAENRPFRVLEIPPAISSFRFDKEDKCLKPYNTVNYLLRNTMNFSSLLTLLCDDDKEIHLYYKKIVSAASKNNGLITSPCFIYDNWIER